MKEVIDNSDSEYYDYISLGRIGAIVFIWEVSPFTELCFPGTYVGR